MTTHFSAALLGGEGRVLAFDRDPQRLARLRANVKAAAASNVEAELADFLSLPLATDPSFRCEATLSKSEGCDPLSQSGMLRDGRLLDWRMMECLHRRAGE